MTPAELDALASCPTKTVVIEVPPAVVAADRDRCADTPDVYEIEIHPVIPGGCMVSGYFGRRKAANVGERRLVMMLMEERDRLKEENDVLRRIPKSEVWYWQGDGSDFPESLGCPVIMSADEVKRLVDEVRGLQSELDGIHSLLAWGGEHIRDIRFARDRFGYDIIDCESGECIADGKPSLESALRSARAHVAAWEAENQRSFWE